MQILPTRWLLPGILALLVLAAPASAQTPPIQASFTALPEQPALGDDVAFTATSTGGTVHAWDLDGDGAFDDAGGLKARTSFTSPGVHTVRLRTSNALYGTSDVAEREFTIEGEPTPTPTPSPAPTTSPEPTPVSNAAPIARLDSECKKVGQMVFCPGSIARQGSAKRISAAPSSDPDGQIVRYQWDIGGDGAFEVDTGTTPFVEHVFEPGPLVLGRNNRRIDVRVRVTDDGGATAESGFAVSIQKAACQQQVKSGALTVEGECLRPNNFTVDGKKIVRYLSEAPVSMGGIAFAPRAGNSIAVDVGGSAPRVASGNASVSMAASGAPVELFAGKFEWKLVGGELRGFALGSGVKLNGLRVTGLAGAVKWASSRATAKVHVALPDDFGAPTSSEPITLGGGASAAGAGALKFSVPSASLGPISLNQLDVSYDGVDLWEIDASVSLPAPTALTVAAGAGIRSDGRFHHAEAEVKFGSGVPLGGPIPVFLQRIKFRVEMSPKKSECVPMVGIVDLRPYLEPVLGKPLPEGIVTSYDAGIPTFAMCGEIGLTAGPSIGGAAAVRLDAGLGWATYADRPWVLRAFGKLSLVEIPLAEATLSVHGDGYITIGGKFHWGIPHVASVRGGLSVQMLKTKFNASGSVDACLDFVDWCVGAKAIVSSKGFAACASIDVIFDDWNPGIGYEWGDAFPTLYFAGCDIGDYKVKINRARARVASAGAGQEIDIASGLPGTALVFKGDGAPPHVSLTGPKGERIASPTDGSGKAQGPGYLVIEDPTTSLTHVLIAKPAGGRWTASTLDGSAPIIEVKGADGLHEPSVRGAVSGRGRTRELRYDVETRPGQSVTFVERGADAGAELGNARGASGTLRFTPADGSAGKRTIVALISQDGQPRAEQIVATFTAPRASAPARVRGLRVRGATARWTKTPGAVSYEVQVRRGDGQTTVRHTKQRSFRVPRAGRVRVTVRPVGASGMVGPRVSVRR